MLSTNRRKFLKNIGISGVTAGLMPISLLVSEEKETAIKNEKEKKNRLSWISLAQKLRHAVIFVGSWIIWCDWFLMLLLQMKRTIYTWMHWTMKLS